MRVPGSGHLHIGDHFSALNRLSPFLNILLYRLRDQRSYTALLHRGALLQSPINLTGTNLMLGEVSTRFVKARRWSLVKSAGELLLFGIGKHRTRSYPAQYLPLEFALVAVDQHVINT